MALKRRVSCGHNLPIYSKGLCKRCYDRLAQRKYRDGRRFARIEEARAEARRRLT